jgi:K+ transporter
MTRVGLCGFTIGAATYFETFDTLEVQQTFYEPPARETMARWRERMFAAMARNAGNVTDYFNIPTNRVIELGTRIEI